MHANNNYYNIFALINLCNLCSILIAQKENTSLYRIHYTSPDAIISYYHFEFEDVPHPSIYTQKLKDIKFTRINGYFLTNYHHNIEGKIYHLVDIFGNDDICDEIPYIPYLTPNTSWIALISQSQKCSINHQIDIIANKAKASGLIIYKNSNSLVDWFISEFPGPPFSSVVVSSPPPTLVPNDDVIDTSLGPDFDVMVPPGAPSTLNLTVVYLPADRAGYLTRHVDTLSARYNLTLRVNISMAGAGSGPAGQTELEEGGPLGLLIPSPHRNHRVRVGLPGGGSTRPYNGQNGGGNAFSARNNNQQATFVSRTSIMFVSISFIVLMIISLAWLVFYYVQRFRYAHAKDQLAKRLNSAAKKALVKIPLRTVKVDDKVTGPDSDACAVCIESFRPNEIIRELKCGHTFHKTCVDTWLLLQRSCPICKLDILEAYGLTIDKSRRAMKSCSSGLRAHDHGGGGGRHHHFGPSSNVTALIFGGGPSNPGGGRRGRRPLSLMTPTTTTTPGISRGDWYYPGDRSAPPTSGPAGTLNDSSSSYVITGNARLFTEFSESTSGELDRIIMSGIVGDGYQSYPKVTYVVHPTSPMPLPITSYPDGDLTTVAPNPPGPDNLISHKRRSNPKRHDQSVASPRSRDSPKRRHGNGDLDEVVPGVMVLPHSHPAPSFFAKAQPSKWTTPVINLMPLGPEIIHNNNNNNHHHPAMVALRCSSTPSLPYASSAGAGTHFGKTSKVATEVGCTPDHVPANPDPHDSSSPNATGSGDSPPSYPKLQQHVLVLPPFLTAASPVTTPTPTNGNNKTADL